MKFNEQKAIDAIQNTELLSIAAVLKEIGMSHRAGGNYVLIKQIAAKHSLDTSHWLGQAIHKGKIFGYYNPIEDYLSNKRGITSHKLKHRLFETNLKERICEKCNISEWNGVPAPLELDHINGVKTDNRLENLRILCPNCHAQTPTYKSKNRK